MFKRILAFCFAMAIVFSLPMTAFAATTTLNCTKSEGNSYYFNVVTTKNGATIKLSMTRGTIRFGFLDDNLASYNDKVVYGAYEIKIAKWNGSSWSTLAHNKDVYNKSSDTITLGEAGTYKIQVYQWTALGTAQSYWRNNVACKVGTFRKNVTSWGVEEPLAAKWQANPTIKATSGNYIKSMYVSTRTGNPK